MKKVIISGAGGFVGSELTRKMIQNGVHVTAISNSFSLAFPDSTLITRLRCKIEDDQSLLNIIHADEYEAFYHLAWVGVNGPQKANPLVQLDNVKMAVACASAANQLGCRKFLCSGTVAENAVQSLEHLEKTSGGMMYGVVKHCAHLTLDSYCKNIGLNLVWMQFSNIYGPQNATGNLVSYTLNEVLKGHEATFGPALQPYDFIFVDDLIEAAYRLGFCETKRNNYFIGSGQPRVLRSYLEEIGEVCRAPELIKTNVRPDDGIVYTMEMFDTSNLVEDIGAYVSKTFSEGIRYTVESMIGGGKNGTKI